MCESPSSLTAPASWGLGKDPENLILYVYIHDHLMEFVVTLASMEWESLLGS